MNTRSLKRGNYKRYSFRDLEYGLKKLYGEIEGCKVALSIINKINEEKKLNQWNRLDTYHIDREIKHLESIIEKVQGEIADRMLTGNDDGVVEKELLGANDV